MPTINDSRMEFVRAVLADAALAFVATVVVGLIIASLAAAGIITMPLAYVLLALAWLVAVAGTFLIPWSVAGRHRAIFGFFLALMLAGLGWYETARYIEPPSAREIALEVSRLLPHPEPKPIPLPAPTVLPQPTAIPTPLSPPKPKIASTYAKVIIECDSPKSKKPLSRKERQAYMDRQVDVLRKVWGYTANAKVTEDEITLEIVFGTPVGSPMLQMNREVLFIKRSEDKLFVTVTRDYAGVLAYMLPLAQLDASEPTIKAAVEQVEKITENSVREVHGTLNFVQRNSLQL